MSGQPTLRDAADAADAAGFVGRAAELDAVDELLDAATPSRIVYVHGPGGIGKSAFLGPRLVALRSTAAFLPRSMPAPFP